MNNGITIVGIIVVIMLLAVSGYYYSSNQSLIDDLGHTKKELNRISMQAEKIQEQRYIPEVDTIEELPVCFNEWRDDQYIIFPRAEAQDWANFDKRHGEFSLKHPKDIIVSQIIAEDEIHMVSEKNRNLEARVSFSLLEEGFAASSVNSPRIVYEAFSDTWWKTPYFGYLSGFASSKECTPNEIGRTAREGYPIYMLLDGDVGYSLIKYFIVIRDPEVNHRPIVITLKTSSNGNDSRYEGFSEFLKTLEQIIQTVESRVENRG
jgi:hypothetical protein